MELPLSKESVSLCEYKDIIHGMDAMHRIYERWDNGRARQLSAHTESVDELVISLWKWWWCQPTGSHSFFAVFSLHRGRHSRHSGNRSSSSSNRQTKKKKKEVN